MRNEWDDQDYGRDEVTALRNRRRKQVLIAVTGLAVLGVGAALVTAQVVDDGQATTRDAAALVPVTPAVTPATSASSATSAVSSAEGTAAPKVPAMSGTPRPKTTKERIAAARSMAAKANAEALKAPAGAAAVPATQAEVTTTEDVQGGEKIKVNSARQDLTGHNELALVADMGKAYGDARCTKKIRVRPGEKPRERPTVLLCWRTSATKSVFTVSIKLDGRPVPARSVTALNKEWTRLG